MFRGDNLVCGTTSTGTTTPLILTEPPAPPGGIGLAEYATAAGNNFVSGNAIPTSYTIIEYTDTTFGTAVKTEKGVGVLTIGTAYGGGTPHTLARSVIQSTATAMSTTPVPIVGGTAVSIGTAANTLVFVGASASDIPAFEPYLYTGGDDYGICPAMQYTDGATTGGTLGASGLMEYNPFILLVPMLVKRAYSKVGAAYTGGTPVSNLYLGLYAVGTDGRPGKLLYDFGSCGANCLNATGVISATTGNGIYLTPGEYYFVQKPVFSGGTGGPSLTIFQGPAGGGINPYLRSGRLGTSSASPVAGLYNIGDTAATMADPANLGSSGPRTTYGTAYWFSLKSS